MTNQIVALDTTNAAASAPTSTGTVTGTAVPADLPPPPSSTEMLMWNVGFVVVMIVLFYMLLIRPQQNRYKEHAEMIKKLAKGDKVILQSGMIAVIDHIADGAQEAVVELSPGQKVHIVRSAIAGRYDEIVKKP